MDTSTGNTPEKSDGKYKLEGKSVVINTKYTAEKDFVL